MNLYEIQIPVRTNDGKGYGPQRYAFEKWLLQYAGGYSRLPDIAGAWLDAGKVYAEAMVPYHVACSAEAFEKIISAAFDLFRDQHAIFYAEIGEATIRHRAIAQAAE